MQTVNYQIDKLVFAEYNPRQLTKDQYQNLKDSITRFGLVDPMIVNTHKERKNILVGGHQRVKVAKDLGFEEVPCVEVKLTPDKEKELNIRLNKNTGEWDYDALANYFDVGELTEWGFTEDDLQFAEPEEITGLIDDDEVPEVEESITKTGDIWILGEHRVLCGDATKKEDIERLMDGQKARMSITSPPYENQRDYSQWESYNDYLNFISQIIENYKKISANDFIVFWNMGSSEPTNNFIPADNYKQFIDNGFKWLEWIIWNKESATWTIPRSQHIEKGLYIPALRWESLMVFSLGKRPHFELSDKKEIRNWQENVWEMNKVIGSQQKKIGHPALFPVELPYRAIKSYSKKNENIYEPFLGGGSTLIACEKTNRKCYGMEIDAHYCDVIVKRWEDYTGKKAERMERVES